MESWSREQIKADPVLMGALEYILSMHETPAQTIKHLRELAHVPNICTETKIFATLPHLPGSNSGAVYLSYEITTWIKKVEGGTAFPTRVERLTLYNDFIEYEATRVKELSSAPPEDRDNSLNLN